MAQAGQRQNIHFDQVLLGHPVLGQEWAASANAGTIDQQVDLPVTFLQFQQEPGEPQRLTQVTGTEQHFHAKTLGQFNRNTFQLITLAGHQNQAAATPGQRFGHRQADAAGSASDQSVTGHAVLHRNSSAPRRRCHGRGALFILAQSLQGAGLVRLHRRWNLVSVLPRLRSRRW
jgi:hypothetical protein